MRAWRLDVNLLSAVIVLTVVTPGVISRLTSALIPPNSILVTRPRKTFRALTFIAFPWLCDFPSATLLLRRDRTFRRNPVKIKCSAALDDENALRGRFAIRGVTVIAARLHQI